MKRKIVTGITAMALVLACAAPAYAGEWKQDSKGQWWQSEDGSYPVNTGMWIDGDHDGKAELYYFDAEGYVLKNTHTDSGYTLNADGAVAFGDEVYRLQLDGPLSAEAVSAGLPNGLAGIYYGKVNGVDVECVITVEDGNYFYTTEFGVGPMPSYVNNGVFDDAETTFIFEGNHLRMIDKIMGNEVYDLIKQ